MASYKQNIDFRKSGKKVPDININIYFTWLVNKYGLSNWFENYWRFSQTLKDQVTDIGMIGSVAICEFNMGSCRLAQDAIKKLNIENLYLLDDVKNLHFYNELNKMSREDSYDLFHFFALNTNMFEVIPTLGTLYINTAEEYKEKNKNLYNHYLSVIKLLALYDERFVQFVTELKKKGLL